MDKNMPTDAEKKFRELMKEAIENSDYEKELKEKIKAYGYDKLDYDTIKARMEAKKRARNSKRLKVASFIIAVFMVSGFINMIGNHNVVLASRFEINNFMFNVRNGFFATEFQFYSTASGRELIITKEEHILVGRDFLRELKIPNFIPADYYFKSLSITNNLRNEYLAIFIYESNMGNTIMITQRNISEGDFVHQIPGIEKDFIIGDVRLLYVPSIITGNNTLFAITHSSLFQISGMFELDDLVIIFEMLK